MRRISIVLTRLATAVVIGALGLLAVAPATFAAGPALVKDINPHGSSNPTELTQVGSTLFFAANDGVHGNELWKSDGTAAGTKMVKNIRPLGKSSDPENLVNVNGTLFFTANDGQHGRELWKSNGTKSGTVMVKDLNPGPANQFGGNSTYIHEGGAFAIGNRLFFLVDWCCIGWGALYVSDGTAAGTLLLNAEDEYFEFPDSFAAGTAAGKFYFVSGVEVDSGYEWQLWVSDGSDAGTHAVAGSPSATEMTILPNNGSKLYFYTNRLWRTNGTAAGTFPLLDVGEAAGYVGPTQSVLLKQRLYFGDVGLWKTDGTVGGTKSISGGDLTYLTATANMLFFARGSHLWKSDGSAAGTIDMGKFGALQPRALIGVGGQLCFSEVNWNTPSWSLWASNGTAAGTYQVRSFVGTPDEMQHAALGSRLFFAADDAIHGAELWSYTP